MCSNRLGDHGWGRTVELYSPARPVAMTPRALATLIGNLLEGAEIEILTGVTEAEAPHIEALEACAALIARAETRA
jgi:hypothetical protein